MQIVGLAWKSGNAVLLKGGREALGTNRALTAVIHRVLEAAGIDPRAAVLLEGREDVAAVLGLHGIVEVIVARGSSEFVRHIMSQSDIPVMGHAAGVCHLYVHEGADPGMAAKLAVDGKTTYPAACNATETLLWDAGAGAALDACAEALKQAGVELRADEATRKRVPWAKPATDADFGFEFGANIIAVKQVGGIDEAMAHIAAHGSKHTEAIVTGDAAAAGRFLAEVDAAGDLPQRQHPLRRRLPLRPGRRGRHQHRQAARARPGRRRGPAHLPLAAARQRPGDRQLRPGQAPVQAPRSLGSWCQSGRGRPRSLPSASSAGRRIRPRPS